MSKKDDELIGLLQGLLDFANNNDDDDNSKVNSPKEKSPEKKALLDYVWAEEPMNDEQKLKRFTNLPDEQRSMTVLYTTYNIKDEIMRAKAFANIPDDKRIMSDIFILFSLDESKGRLKALASLPAEQKTFKNLFEVEHCFKRKAKCLAIAYELLPDKEKTYDNWEKFKGESQISEALQNAHDELSIEEISDLAVDIEKEESKIEQTKLLIPNNDLQKDMEEKPNNKMRFGIGIAIGIVGLGLIGLGLLHAFCPPAALAIDAVLIKVGISAGAAAIAVPTVAGAIGLSSAIFGGHLIKTRKQLPKAPKEITGKNQMLNYSGENVQHIIIDEPLPVQKTERHFYSEVDLRARSGSTSTQNDRNESEQVL